ncbi:hypothetical protein JG688_00014984 [Phytophthora aleatoria]|uniref:non-specific serine/threonine protein kinase n=1 Tax=Phytophthora aleatoria TaxID=2496075 RepID=A0A8J5IB02_9STRA|nr:hypothetical protein JG688_00014984 [Phytophthora aleatoria]
MLSRVPPGDQQPTKHRVQCSECPVAVVYNGKDRYCRRAVSDLASVSSSAENVAGYADPVVTSRVSEAQRTSRTCSELPILRAQYVARGVRVLFGSRWRLNRFQVRTIVLRTGGNPTLAVYAEDKVAALFDPSTSKARPEATCVLALSTNCEFIGSAEEMLLIMPQLPGTTLLQLLRQRRRLNDQKFSNDEGWRFLARLAELLQAVHQSGIIHCDLTLENQMTGTPGFVAPERVQDPLVPPTPKTDVFSALTGQHPYTDATREKRPLQLLDSLCLDWTQAAKVMTEHSISPELRDMVGEMLKADPQARVSLDSVVAVECRSS